ncbi:MAG: hypothetical protein HKN16_08015, partial [Saprospiraceae bacterium]|nr:hypothetical protein [Saprospiraceae bacterium]
GDDIRKPRELKDFSEKKNKHSPRKDYYLSVQFARLIVLGSKSPVKLVFTRKLSEWVKDEQSQKPEFTKDQILTVIELTKAMGLVSCQTSVERKLKKSLFSNPDQYREWWRFRSGLLGYSVETLQKEMGEVGKKYKGKSLRQMLMKSDKYEIIRMAVVELFLALGNSENYARQMGDLAKIFGKELQVEIRDDRKDSIPLMPQKANPELIRQLKDFSRQGTLSL